MANLVLIAVTALVLTVTLMIQPSRSQCNNQFLREPATVAGSPLTCNILDAEAKMTCRVEGEGFNIGWFFTTDRDQAGDTNSLVPLATGGRYSITSSASQGVLQSDLTIPSYSRSYDGYYWCEIVNILNPPSGFFNPSQVVFINANFTLDQLPSCPMAIDFSADTTRCAFGSMDGGIDIVVGAEFTNITATTSTAPPETTTDFTTETPTDPTTTTTTVRRETTTPSPDPTTESEGGTNVVRTALIWFAVGGAVLILLTIGLILCIVAWAKC